MQIFNNSLSFTFQDIAGWVTVEGFDQGVESVRRTQGAPDWSVDNVGKKPMSSWGKCVSQRPSGMRSPAPLHPALCRGAGEPFQPVLPGQVLTDHFPALPAGLCGSFGDPRGPEDC